MLAYLTVPVRVAVLAAALAFAAHAVDARATAADPPTTARTTARTKTDANTSDRDEFPLGGVLIIIGIVGVVIVLAWVCSRVGDNRSAL